MKRKCWCCRDPKPLDEFHVDRSRKHGRKYICKLCVKLWAVWVADEQEQQKIAA